MKRCTKCGEEKPESEFFIKDKRIGKLHAQCKVCYKIHRRSYYAQHYATYKEAYLARAKKRREEVRSLFRQNMLAYLADKACVDCGENDMRVLEFDHINPSQKKFNISQAMKLGHTWDDVILELEKCRVLCANCHKKRTAAQFNWYKNGGADRN